MLLKQVVSVLCCVEIPGCPAPHHGAFLQQLTDLLSKEMASNGGQLPTELASNAQMSLEEKSVRWKFLSVDRNGDEVSIGFSNLSASV